MSAPSNRLPMELAFARAKDAGRKNTMTPERESSIAGNLLVFDDKLPAMLPIGCPEIARIQALVAQPKNMLEMQKVNGVYELEAWVESGFPR